MFFNLSVSCRWQLSLPKRAERCVFIWKYRFMPEIILSNLQNGGQWPPIRVIYKLLLSVTKYQPQNQQHLVVPVKGRCHALRDKRVVKADYLYWLSVINKYIYKLNRRGVHWTPMQTAGLHFAVVTARYLHQISFINPWKSNTTKKPQRISLRFAMVDLHRLELWTVRLWAGCSNQLS